MNARIAYLKENPRIEERGPPRINNSGVFKEGERRGELKCGQRKGTEDVTWQILKGKGIDP